MALDPKLPAKDWRSESYYCTESPCCICGSTEQIGLEPRFFYAVCEEHSRLSPVEVGQRMTRRKSR